MLLKYWTLQLFVFEELLALLTADWEETGRTLAHWEAPAAAHTDQDTVGVVGTPLEGLLRQDDLPGLYVPHGHQVPATSNKFCEI